MSNIKTFSNLRSKSMPLWLKSGLKSKKTPKSRSSMQKLSLFSQLGDSTRALSKNGLAFNIVPELYEENVLINDSYKTRLFQCLCEDILKEGNGLSAVYKSSNTNSTPKGCIGYADMNLYFLNGERKLTVLLENPIHTKEISILNKEEKEKLEGWFFVLLNFSQTKMKGSKVKRIAVHNPPEFLEESLKEMQYSKSVLELKDSQGQLTKKECWIKTGDN